MQASTPNHLKKIKIPRKWTETNNKANLIKLHMTVCPKSRNHSKKGPIKGIKTKITKNLEKKGNKIDRKLLMQMPLCK